MIIKGNSVGYPLPDPRKGLKMQGGINMNGQKITGLNAPATDDEAANKGYVDTNKVDKSRVVNDFTTTEEGFVADARALKVLNDTKLSMELLWENASPTSEFASQTITLPKECDMMLVNYYGMGSNTANMAAIVTNVNADENLIAVQIDGSKSYLCARTASLRGKNAIFGAGYFVQAGSGTTSTNNGVCKPTRIYGIKGVSE